MNTPEEVNAFAWRDVQLAYARWYFGVTDLGYKFQDTPECSVSEDLGDFAESIQTIMTFGPNPRFMDPPIYPTRSEAVRMGHSEVDVLVEDMRGEDDA